MRFTQSNISILQEYVTLEVVMGAAMGTFLWVLFYGHVFMGMFYGHVFMGMFLRICFLHGPIGGNLELSLTRLAGELLF